MPFSFRKHIVPPVVGIVVMASVLGLLNGELLMAQWRYRTAERTTVSAVALPTPPPSAPAQAPDPNAPSELSIPAINVKAPIVFDEPSTNEGKVQMALRRGVVRYGQTGTPGQPGNTVILGHSSGQPWAPGDYKWIFTLLDKLQPGDHIQISYQGIEYIYKITGSEVVAPDNLSILTPTAGPTLTLVTCTPVGTSKNRLVVRATQISPVPTAAETGQTAKHIPQTPKQESLPGSDHSTSLWQSIRNRF